MKNTNKYNKIDAFFAPYIGVSTQNDDAFFTMSGCDACDGGGNNVYEVEMIDKNHLTYTAEICHRCLCYYYNGE